MFTDLTEEQQLYHSLATVGNLLLRLGDAGKQFRAQANASGEGTLSVTSHSVSGDTLLSSSSSMNQIPHSSSTESQGEVFLGPGPRVFEGDGVAKETSSEAALQTLPDIKAGGEGVIMEGKPASTEGNSEDSNLGLEKESSANTNNTATNDSDNSDSQGNQEDEVLSTRSVSESQVSSSSSLSRPDEGWSISFEQFLASMLTEGTLVNYFESIHDVSDAIARMRNRRLVTRQASVP